MNQDWLNISGVNIQDRPWGCIVCATSRQQTIIGLLPYACVAAGNLLFTGNGYTTVLGECRKWTQSKLFGSFHYVCVPTYLCNHLPDNFNAPSCSITCLINAPLVVHELDVSAVMIIECECICLPRCDFASKLLYENSHVIQTIYSWCRSRSTYVMLRRVWAIRCCTACHQW